MAQQPADHDPLVGDGEHDRARLDRHGRIDHDHTVTPLAPGWEAEAVQAKDILGAVVQATTRVE